MGATPGEHEKSGKVSKREWERTHALEEKVGKLVEERAAS